MTLRRRRLWLVFLAGLVLVGGVWWWVGIAALWCKDAERIENGMTREQVWRTLGRKPDTYRCFVSQGACDGDHWRAVDGDFIILFDSDDRVIWWSVSVTGVIRCQWDRLRERFGY